MVPYFNFEDGEDVQGFGADEKPGMPVLNAGIPAAGPGIDRSCPEDGGEGGY